MACTKTNTHNNTKTRNTPRRNRHLEKNEYFYCVFFLFAVYSAQKMSCAVRQNKIKKYALCKKEVGSPSTLSKI